MYYMALYKLFYLLTSLLLLYYNYVDRWSRFFADAIDKIQTFACYPILTIFLLIFNIFYLL